MDTTYTSTFPCKVISSFYDNYYNIHKYDDIKKITFRIQNIDTEFDQEILNYFKLFQMIYSLPINASEAEYRNCFKLIYDKEVINLSLLTERMEAGICMFEWIDKYLLRFKEMESCESYFFFILLTIYLTKEYNYTCVPPVNLYEIYQTIKNDNSRKYFLYSYFNTLFVNNKKRNPNLKEEIINFLYSEKDKLIEKGIKSMFLFGSIYKNEYHSNSDIDLMVLLDDPISFKTIKESKKYISTIILNTFHRSCDIVEYNDFVESHDISNTYKIF